MPTLPNSSLEDIFERLKLAIPGYETRPQQLDLAAAIERAFDTHRPGIFEAGTGTGKSLAALIPAALAGKRVVVSTATISLQEQYINKDIPTLQAALPFEIKASLLKGRGNYLGLRRYEDHLLQEEIDPRLTKWVNATEYGDVSELEFSPPLDSWAEINSDSDDCLRAKCKRFDDCHYFKAKRRAEEANILVVNHSLLLADAVSEGNILPAYELLIVDEAHQMPEIATKSFSLSISARGLHRLTSRSTKNVGAPAHMVQNIEELGSEFFEQLFRSVPFGKARFKNPLAHVDQLLLAINVLRDWLSSQEFEHALDVDNARDKLKAKAKALTSTATRFIRCLELVHSPSPEWVLWTEKSDSYGGRIELVAAPLKVAELLNDYLFSKHGLLSSIWMSATLATAGDDPFEFFKAQVGAPRNVIQDKISSPFDYPRQSLLYLPSGLPEPNDQRFVEYAASEVEKILRLTNGRAFVLFTSYTSMNNAFEILEGRLPFECRRQGQMSRHRLIDWFKETSNAVLFGTSSFWEGVSIDGDQLSCVIIDRIPFQAPDDPVYEARCEAIKDQGDSSWFYTLALPHAIMRLKQGVGRLIRTKSDRGIVALLDSRVTKKAYGRLILGCLPPMTVIKSLRGCASVEEILDDVLCYYD